MSPGRIFKNHSLFNIHTHPQMCEKFSSGRETQKQTKNKQTKKPQNKQKNPHTL